nr:hypothetical protein [Tanacetum cinerariifolium]
MIGLYHVVPPPYTRNYMPSRADLSFAGLDNFVFKSKVSETITDMPKIKTNASKTSKDSLEKLKTVRSSAPLIKDWESDSEDKNVFEPKEVKKTVKPSLEKIKFVNANNTTVENKNKAKKPRKRVEDLQLCVESYQKKLKLTRPDTYHFDLKRKEAYIAYSNPRGFIYQNKDKQNRLMQIDELHKFSDGTLIDVRTALDDRLKEIRIKYL